MDVFDFALTCVGGFPGTKHKIVISLCQNLEFNDITDIVYLGT